MWTYRIENLKVLQHRNHIDILLQKQMIGEMPTFSCKNDRKAVNYIHCVQNADLINLKSDGTNRNLCVILLKILQLV